MKHHEIDWYAKQSRLYWLDPRAKLMGTVFLIASVAFLRSWEPLLVCLSFILISLSISGVPMRHYVRSYSMAAPFVLFAFLTLSYSTGLEAGAQMAVRISVSVLTLFLLASTTPFFDLLKAMRWFRFPELLSTLLLFTYRFTFVFVEELDNMRSARRARGFSGRGNLLNRDVMRTISFTAGMVLVRSYKRAGRIYDALLSRGYDGEVRTLNDFSFGSVEAVYTFAFTFVSIFAIALQLDVTLWTL
jgi:cobalt/nickel transport system permease protein